MKKIRDAAFTIAVISLVIIIFVFGYILFDELLKGYKRAEAINYEHSYSEKMDILNSDGDIE